MSDLPFRMLQQLFPPSRRQISFKLTDSHMKMMRAHLEIDCICKELRVKKRGLGIELCFMAYRQAGDLCMRNLSLVKDGKMIIK